MTLGEVVQALGTFSDEATILAEEPWTAASLASVQEFSIDLPVAQMSQGAQRYFLEVSIAKEIAEDLRASGWLDGAAFCDRLVSYAINDA